MKDENYAMASEIFIRSVVADPDPLLEEYARFAIKAAEVFHKAVADEDRSDTPYFQP